jgi:telomerase reverse transcriptase
MASGALRTPSNIVFVRNRMLYARAALNAQGSVTFGLRHIRRPTSQSSLLVANVLDVLNRQSYRARDNKETNADESLASKPHQSTIHVMMYIFPRQFGLHNVFTHDVDHRETVQPFKDYTLREDEISKIYPSPSTVKIPKRLRGKAAALVQKLQVLHNRCPYKKLLEYYCPVSAGYANCTVLY